jgi:hypothetical protein
MPIRTGIFFRPFFLRWGHGDEEILPLATPATPDPKNIIKKVEIQAVQSILIQ